MLANSFKGDAAITADMVAIDQNLCTGCRECAEVCPAYAIVGEQGKPQTIDTDKCIMCGQCVQKCKSYVSILTHGKEAYEKVRKERNIPVRRIMCKKVSFPIDFTPPVW